MLGRWARSEGEVEGRGGLVAQALLGPARRGEGEEAWVVKEMGFMGLPALQ